MPRKPLGKNYSLSAQHEQHLNDKAVALTQVLARPVACRHVLGAILDLALSMNNQSLAEQVQRRLDEPRRDRKPGPGRTS